MKLISTDNTVYAANRPFMDFVHLVFLRNTNDNVVQARELIMINLTEVRPGAVRGCFDEKDIDLDSLEFMRLNYRWNARFSALLTRLRRRFGGDLDQLLIYMVFVEAEACRRVANDRRKGPQGLNALTIANITGVPRESVRRKLRILTETRFLRYGLDGLYYPAEDFGQDDVSADLKNLFLAASPIPRRRGEALRDAQ